MRQTVDEHSPTYRRAVSDRAAQAKLNAVLPGLVDVGITTRPDTRERSRFYRGALIKTKE